MQEVERNWGTWVLITEQLREEPLLKLRDFYGRRAFLVVVCHAIDPTAYGVTPHQPSI
jgi:hypothetical protein